MVPGKTVLRITTVWRSLLSLQCSADLLAHVPNVSQIEIAIDLARGAHADERQFRVLDSLRSIAP